MRRGIAWYLVPPLIALGLVGCRFDFEEREPWRAEAEEQCLAKRLVQPSNFLEPGEAVNGKGVCGMTKPFKVAAVSGGFVEFKPKATLSCPLVANVEAWFHEAIQPAAIAWYGSPVTEIKQISAYSCRTMNGQRGTPISEHAFGNALDIASFRFANGREVDFKSGWKGKQEERGFLRAVHAAACERFSTVLAPGSNAFHYDHIHVDLARRASGRQVCNPAPMTLPTPPPRYPDSMPVAGTPPMRSTLQASNESVDPYAISRAAGPERHVPMQGSVANVPAGSTSPWAQSGQHAAPVPPGGPALIARENGSRPVGPPLALGSHRLGNQAPPAHSFGTPLPLVERVRQSLGTPAPVQDQGPPMRQPRQQNPYGLVPPGRIPNARLGADPAVTGSIAPEKTSAAKDKLSAAKAKKAAENAEQEKAPAAKERIGLTGKVETGLVSPTSVAEQTPRLPPASVFDLPPLKP